VTELYQRRYERAPFKGKRFVDRDEAERKEILDLLIVLAFIARGTPIRLDRDGYPFMIAALDRRGVYR